MYVDLNVYINKNLMFTESSFQFRMGFHLWQYAP